MNITPIILALITLIFAVLSYYIVPLLKRKIQAENDRLSENQAALLMLAIKTAVRAAEQVYESDEGKKKKAYVEGLLRSQGFEVDSAAVDAAIEAAVLELHRSLEE